MFGTNIIMKAQEASFKYYLYIKNYIYNVALLQYRGVCLEKRLFKWTEACKKMQRLVIIDILKGVKFLVEQWKTF